jgi:hypothetical protein
LVIGQVLPLPQELQLCKDLGTVVWVLCFVPHFLFVFAVEDLEFVFLQSLDCNDLRDWLLLIFAAPEEVAWNEGRKETLPFLRLSVAQVKAINT